MHLATWLAGKTFEATTPLGPYLVTPEEFPPGEVDLELTCSVNGEQMQRSRTSDLLFGVPALIAYVSQVITLRPGDVIATGSPSGVGGLMKPLDSSNPATCSPRPSRRSANSGTCAADAAAPPYARKDAPWQFSDWATSESGSTTSRR